MSNLQWEAMVLILGISAWFTLTIIGARRSGSGNAGLNLLTVKAQAALSEVQGAALILGVLALVGGVAVWAIFFSSAVSGCESNLRAIQAAAESYRSATHGSMPATVASIVVASGSTAGTFSNPNQTSVDYLGQAPIDPVNPTGSYSWTYTAATPTAAELYVITCPGIHTKADFGNMAGIATETAGKIQFSSSGGNAGFKAI